MTTTKDLALRVRRAIDSGHELMSALEQLQDDIEAIADPTEPKHAYIPNRAPMGQGGELRCLSPGCGRELVNPVHTDAYTAETLERNP